MNEANGLNIRVHEFFQKADPVKDEKGKETGEIITRDWVKYGPPHLMDRQVIEALVSRVLSAKMPVPGSKNPAEHQAWQRAEYIRPLYEAWKRGEELPDNGIPLAACNFLRSEDVASLKRSGIRSVQELASFPDSAIDKVQVPAMREKRTQAARFLEAQDLNKASAAMAARDDKIADLERKLAALLEANGAPADDMPEVDEHGDRIPKRRGRPPNVARETAASEAA